MDCRTCTRPHSTPFVPFKGYPSRGTTAKQKNVKLTIDSTEVVRKLENEVYQSVSNFAKCKISERCPRWHVLA